jgi:hypothetical protein
MEKQILRIGKPFRTDFGYTTPYKGILCKPRERIEMEEQKKKILGDVLSVLEQTEVTPRH